ncbi:DUF5677 domain-containing protein [Ralstonia pseudosolanacearum]|uniref:DUF5677 domain-containing protein n=1 Tax=Ralstonia pseudosolanacearum TaxID=1310165 RepID=UPI00115F9549|nr:DUF5677 domain-containing protein [Ralstonia pseudosolanacearum]MCL1620168.1 DUF5677 domain-containing protein [Ralstonia pseudosolanacearum CaRs-Mep]
MSEQDEGQEIPDIKRVEVSPEELANFTDEEDFTGLSVDLMIEQGSWTCLTASLLPGETRKWDRDQAILGGLLVRFYKLASALLDQTCQHRRETTFVLGRLAIECMINIQYLVSTNSKEVYQAYVIDSLRHEKKLMDRIETNIASRSGVMLPIEARMLGSIQKSFDKSGVKPEEVTKQAAKPWKDVDLYQRADTVGLGEAYLGLFGGPSHNVHGSWQDLIEYHLHHDGEGFTPELAWHRPRPQVLFTLARIGVETLMAYLEHFAGDGAEGVISELRDLGDRIEIANRAHEAFLSARQSKEVV